MMEFKIDPAQRRRANRPERALTLLRLWWGRPDLLRAILAIKGAPSKLRHPARWFDLASRMLRPMTCVTWTVDQKVGRIADHHEVTRQLGGVLAQGWGDPRRLMTLSPVGSQYSIKIDEAYWMTGDGLTTMSLWHGIDRMFTVGFVLGRERGRTIAYIGGLQGRGTDSALQLYRDMTKDAKGLRPRDLMIETFRMFCKAIGVSEIRAVAEQSRSWHDRFADETQPYIASLNYDEAWVERGGHRHCADWFVLPLEAQRRSEDEIPSRKRALYRQRYAMLDAIEEGMAQAVARRVPGSLKMRVLSLYPAKAVNTAKARILA